MIAGYFGGTLDHIIQGMIDISWAFPTVLMAIFLVATFGPGLVNVMVAVGLVYWAVTLVSCVGKCSHARMGLCHCGTRYGRQ